jgi:hypothetical protein
MTWFRKPDARAKAGLASLAAVAALVILLVWRPAGLLSVALALCCVLLGVIAGVAVTAAREVGGNNPADGGPATDGYELDADTLDALDAREVRESRRVTGLSDR